MTIEQVRERRAEIDARMTAIYRGEIEPVAIVVKDRGDAVRSIKVVDRRRGTTVVSSD